MQIINFLYLFSQLYSSFYSVVLCWKVNDLQVGLTVNLRNQEGTLKLILLDSGCHVRDLSIKLHGGAAWLYQV